jgi:uncharacterized iron-regulated membrane protein
MNGDLYRAFWRWHFYAGLFVLPFLALLAVTGSIYLFKPEVERLVYGNWIVLDAPARPLPASKLIAATERQAHGKVTQVEVPRDLAESWRFRVQTSDGARTAFVDPGTGKLLGTTEAGGIMKTVRDLHSLAITGTLGNALIEIAAGWAIVLVVTGIVLWWPRSGEPAIALRAPPQRRRFWRDLHSSTGILASAIILFLAVTGMPWSVFWGANVQALVAKQGLGRPKAPGPSPWELEKGGHHGSPPRAERESLPWTLQAAPEPHAHGHGDIGPDTVIAIASQRGLSAPYTLNIPQAAGQPYSVSRTAVRADDARAIYVDPANGKVLQDAGYSQFGNGAQIIEWGIATHQGQQYGSPNRWAMLFGCAALLLLCISAPVLWWKRRVQGRLKPPPPPLSRAQARTAAATVAILGLIYPLSGVTMLAIFGLDRTLLLRSSSTG